MSAVRRLLALLVATVAVAGCGSAAAPSPPATGAAALVPADALAYVNVSLDRDRPAVRAFVAMARRAPGLAALAGAVEHRLGELAAGGAGFSKLPAWLGGEAAIALLDTTTTTAGTLLILDVRDASAARSYVAAAGARVAGRDHGTTVWRYGNGTELAFVRSFLVLGQPAGVRAAIAVAGAGGSLAASPAYRRAAAGEPAGRVLDAYASAAGVSRLLAPQAGLVGALGSLLYRPALAAVTVSASPAAGGLRLRIHSALSAGLLTVGARRAVPLRPTLQRVVPAGAIAMIDASDLSHFAPQVLAAAAAGGIGAGIAPLLSRLGTALQAEGVDVGGLLGLFGGETAVAVTGGVRPALLILARISDPAAVRAQLASLEVPFQQLFQRGSAETGAASADAFAQTTVDGTTIHHLQLEPGLQLDYAVTGGLLAVSTGIGAITAVAAHSRALAGDAGYRAVLPDIPSRVTSLTYLDFSQLLGLGEQTGLTRSAGTRALSGDLQEVRAVGLSSTGGEADSTTELFLQIP